LIIGFQDTVENVGDVYFGTQIYTTIMHMVCFRGFRFFYVGWILFIS